MNRAVSDLVAAAKAGSLKTEISRYYGSGPDPEFRIASVGLTAANYQCLMWDADLKLIASDSGWSWWDNPSGISSVEDTLLQIEHSDGGSPMVETIAGISVGGDGLFNGPVDMTGWTSCEFVYVDGTRCWGFDVTKLPPALRYFDLSSASCNLDGVDFRALDAACPNLEVLVLNNDWEMAGGCIRPAWGQIHTVLDDLRDKGPAEQAAELANRLMQPDDNTGNLGWPNYLDNCKNPDYLFTAPERSYGIYWGAEGALGEYWAPGETRPLITIPQHRLCFLKLDDDSWELPIYEGLLEAAS